MRSAERDNYSNKSTQSALLAALKQPPAPTTPIKQKSILLPDALPDYTQNLQRMAALKQMLVKSNHGEHPKKLVRKMHKRCSSGKASAIRKLCEEKNKGLLIIPHPDFDRLPLVNALHSEENFLTIIELLEKFQPGLGLASLLHRDKNQDTPLEHALRYARASAITILKMLALMGEVFNADSFKIKIPTENRSQEMQDLLDTLLYACNFLEKEAWAEKFVNCGAKDISEAEIDNEIWEQIKALRAMPVVSVPSRYDYLSSIVSESDCVVLEEIERRLLNNSLELKLAKEDQQVVDEVQSSKNHLQVQCLARFHGLQSQHHFAEGFFKNYLKSASEELMQREFRTIIQKIIFNDENNHSAKRKNSSARDNLLLMQRFLKANYKLAEIRMDGSFLLGKKKGSINLSLYQYVYLMNYSQISTILFRYLGSRKAWLEMSKLLNHKELQDVKRIQDLRKELQGRGLLEGEPNYPIYPLEEPIHYARSNIMRSRSASQ